MVVLHHGMFVVRSSHTSCPLVGSCGSSHCSDPNIRGCLCLGAIQYMLMWYPMGSHFLRE